MSHKKRDWSKYNKPLVNRGSITFWIAPEIASLGKRQLMKAVEEGPLPIPIQL